MCTALLHCCCAVLQPYTSRSPWVSFLLAVLNVDQFGLLKGANCPKPIFSLQQSGQLPVQESGLQSCKTVLVAVYVKLTKSNTQTECVYFCSVQERWSDLQSISHQECSPDGPTLLRVIANAASRFPPAEAEQLSRDLLNVPPVTLAQRKTCTKQRLR